MNEMDLMERFCAEEPPPRRERLAAARARLVAAIDGAEAPGPAAARERRTSRAGSAANRRARGRSRIVISSAVVGAAVCAAVVVPAVTGGKGSGLLVTAAWAVDRNSNGTVTVKVRNAQVFDPAGLQRALRAAGVRARVVSPPATLTRLAPGLLILHSVCVYQPTRVGG